MGFVPGIQDFLNHYNIFLCKLFNVSESILHFVLTDFSSGEVGKWDIIISRPRSQHVHSALEIMYSFHGFALTIKAVFIQVTINLHLK